MLSFSHLEDDPVMFNWKTRSVHKCFEDCEMLVEELKKLVVESLYMWAGVYNVSIF